MLLFVLKNNGSLPLAIFPTLGYNKSTIADKETNTMKDGFLKIACVTPPLRVADCTYNADQIIAKAKEAAQAGAKLAAFPELCLTGSGSGTYQYT